MKQKILNRSLLTLILTISGVILLFQVGKTAPLYSQEPLPTIEVTLMLIG